MSELTRMEIDRLEEEVAELTASWLRLATERDRYRAALERIASVMDEPGLWEEKIVELAREALGDEA